MQELIQFVLDNLGYGFIFLFMIVESSFIPFPSEVIVPPAAWLAMKGDDMNVFLVVVVATLGAVIGALVNYVLALWLGRPVVYRFAESKLGHICLLNSEKMERAEVYFREHGVISTLIGRLVPGVRQLISIPAGLARMKIGPFLAYTAIGAGIWNSVLALLGCIIAWSTPDIKTTKDVGELASRYSHEIGFAILVLVVMALGWFVYKKYGKTLMKAVDEDEDEQNEEHMA